jgi:hypothetical protein
MKGTMYDDIEVIKAAVTRVVEAIEKSDLQKSMRSLVDRAKRGALPWHPHLDILGKK